MKKTYITNAIGILIAIALGYYFRATLAEGFWQLEVAAGIASPCDRPIPYSLGTFDSQFGLTKAQFLTDITEAVKPWQDAAGRTLFLYATTTGPDDLKVNLVYDYRQQATTQLQQIGGTIKGDKATYDAMKAQYDALSSAYASAKAQVQADLQAHNARTDAYEQQVAYWNGQGGAPKAQYDQLQQEKASLDAETVHINQEADAANAMVDKINSLVSSLNTLGHELNLNVSQYNTVGSSTGPEFSEGEYVQNSAGQSVNIYQFNDHDQLVRVLEHEFGHALGLQHVDDPKAVMYYLNEGTNEKLAPEDIAELKTACKMQ